MHYLWKHRGYVLVFGSSIDSKHFDSGMENIFYLSFEKRENMSNFTLLFEEIDPSKMRVVINKYNVVFIAFK
jgi:hypothetical protein